MLQPPVMVSRLGWKVANSSLGMVGEAVYQVDDKKYNCKFDRIDRGVDNWGDAYKATGFYCTKDLYITVKEPQDNRKVLFIVVNPAKFEERKAYYADMFIEYKKEEK